MKKSSLLLSALDRSGVCDQEVKLPPSLQISSSAIRIGSKAFEQRRLKTHLVKRNQAGTIRLIKIPFQSPQPISKNQKWLTQFSQIAHEYRNQEAVVSVARIESANIGTKRRKLAGFKPQLLVSMIASLKSLEVALHSRKKWNNVAVADRC
ncbi:unnamed protein product [Acanthoscelides obtectus]|uniref:Uncharacterized protein n=1 Tax=Acanthoscelides obtectus TaxID=200917 RepID=A0A9P0JSS8_ACAOB|nr:unnamed protein product [Acanthoscelides obtectus]